MALISAMSNLNIKQDQIWNSESKIHTANWDVAETHEANAGTSSITKPHSSDASKHYSKSTMLSERDRLIEEQIANFQTLKPEEQTNELRSLFMGDTESLLTLRPTDLGQNQHIGPKFHTPTTCGHDEQKNLHLYHQNNGYNQATIDDSFKENYYAKSVAATKFKSYANNNVMYPNYTSNVPNYFNALRVNKDSHWTYNQNDYRARSHLNYQEELNKARIAFYLNSQEQLNKEQLALAACFAQSEPVRMNNVCDENEVKVAETDLGALPVPTTEVKNDNDSEGVRGDKCQKTCNFKGYGVEGEIEGGKNDSRDGSPFEKYPSSSDGQSDGESDGDKARRGSLEDVMADFRANGWDTEAGSSGAIQQTDVSGLSGTNLNLGNPLLARHAYSRHQSYPPTRNILPESTQATLKTASSADQMDLFRLLLAHQQNSAVNRPPSGLQNLNGAVPRTWSDNSTRFQPLSNAANPLFSLASQNLVSFPPSSHTPSVANNVIVPGLNFNAQAELIQANLLNGFQGHYKKREKRTVQAECGFCRNNGEQPFLYKNHSLKDATGRVLCPILRDFRCPNCDATGDHAHTIKYCPQAGSQDAVPSLTQLRSLRMANGRRRFPPFSALENQPKWFQS